jgi:hypothetical protein
LAPPVDAVLARLAAFFDQRVAKRPQTVFAFAKLLRGGQCFGMGRKFKRALQSTRVSVQGKPEVSR